MSRTPAPYLQPRLLTDAQAAAYLNIPQTKVKHLPRGRVEIAGRVRWDREELDAWLDELAGKVASSAPSGSQDDAEAALARWLANKRDDARAA